MRKAPCYAQITGCGHDTPERVVANHQLEERWSLPQGWIKRRTGIEQRSWAKPDQAVSDMAIAAGIRALTDADLDPGRVDLVILATSTPDYLLPPTAPFVAAKMGCTNAGAFDLAGACCGFLYGLSMAESHVALRHQVVLVIGANLLSRRLKPDDPATACLFADAAGAVVLQPSETPTGLLGVAQGANGAQWDTIMIAEGGSRANFGAGTWKRRGHLMTMKNGGSLFREAVHDMATVGRQAMADAALQMDAIDWWIPHQANGRLIEEARKALDVPVEKTQNRVARFGNSSAATIPLVLSVAVAEGEIQRGQTLLLTAVGAGMLRMGLVWSF
ncbi:3-oxoacyl-ACP synthase III family protein [Acanthopleuribacter pedis]|uniref:Beta-ketoacyl-ACP synthase 3 n=1 Tax=Acanthopleuribacter pedis TaxID=442870 RepID=A0A8J7QDI9_9BACT|nr:beta-ketoacyl-ACP synthase 3 [Acanthopleuribacter pedis]MBO1317093.1 beta-ketoacyl-ACP synthase 3 [Acanthopleuribacter pedis]